jgi:hypothetical protein
VTYLKKDRSAKIEFSVYTERPPLGDEPFSIDCVGIDLGCYDFILGVDFLSTLGPIFWDLDVLSLIFWREGGHHV